MNVIKTSSFGLQDKVSPEEWEIRVNLAACYRIFGQLGITDFIYNHITARAPGPDHHILINAFGMLYEEITASSLHKIDLDGEFVMRGESDFGVNGAGYMIHSAVHSARADAGCVIHTHTRASCAVAAMEGGLLPLSLNAMALYAGVRYHDYERPQSALEERPRLIADLGDNDIMILRNHGTLTVGRNIEHAFHLATRLENACRIQVDAMGAGAVITPSPDITGNFSAPRFSPSSALLWQAMRRKLDRIDPSYAT